jgi:hypothetical protein
MIFNAISADNGSKCSKCGKNRPGVSIIVMASSGRRVLITICERCIFESVIGVEEFRRAAEKADGKYEPKMEKVVPIEPIDGVMERFTIWGKGNKGAPA